MNKTWIKTAIACALATTPLHATDWTNTLDLTEPGLQWAGADGPIGASNEAMWFGDRVPADPRSGATLSVFAVPDRITINPSQSLRAVSSRRGVLWDRDLDANAYSVPDSQGSIWSIRDGAVLTQVAADGAQVRQWTATDFGAPNAQLGAMQLASDRNAVLLVVRTPSANAFVAETLWLDPMGRVSRRHPAPACTNAAHDDGAGGFYAVCGGGTSGSIQRIAADGPMTWNAPQVFAGLDLVRVTRDGGLLIHQQTGTSGTWRHLDARGFERFNRAGALAAESGNGFWIANTDFANSGLVHVDASGAVLGQADLPGTDALALVAHASGSVMLDSFNPYGGLFGEGYKTLFDSSGQVLRRVVSTSGQPGLQSRIRFERGLPYAMSPDLAEHATLIDDAGHDTSAPFPVAVDQFPVVLADAQTVCTDTYTSADEDEASYRDIRCFARASGVQLGRMTVPGVRSSQALLGVNGVVTIRQPGRLSVYTTTGARLNDIPLGQSSVSQRFDFNPAVGTAVWNNDSAAQVRLRRYAINGELLVDAAIPAERSGSLWQLFLSPDGSMFAYSRVLNNAHVDRYAADGSFLGTCDFSRPGSGDDVIGVHANAVGVQLLLQPFNPNDAIGARLLVLSPDLGTLRLAHPLGKEADVGLWPTTAGEPLVAVSGRKALALRRYHSGSGAVLSRAVLPTLDSASVNPRDAVSFSIDALGTVRMLESDVSLVRDVVRVFQADAHAFTGRVGQRALAGSWYAPNSTGQGLIVDLLNGATQLFAAWHTYSEDGGNSLARQQWLTVQGDVADERGAITLPIYRNSGGRFDLEGRTNAVPVGSAELVFTSCDRMEFWYRIGDEIGALPLQRLTPRTQACDDGVQTQPPADTAAAIDLSGAWYDPARSGQGLAVSASGARFNSFLAGWFTYDATTPDDADAQHWFTLQGASPNGYGQTVASEIFRTIGGSRSGEPTRNTHRVGVAQLTVHDCANATLEYVFDDSPVAGAFADRTRAISLKRLGVCTN